MSEIKVLIAGGGPVGMTLAAELAARQVRCMVVERNPSTTAHPKMDITNARSMEIFRRLGLVDSLRAAAVSPKSNFDVSWVTTMSGDEVHRFRYPSVEEKRGTISRRNDGSQAAEPPMRVSQVEIEPVLKSAIDAMPEVDVRFGVALEDFNQDPSGVTALLRDCRTGHVDSVRCEFLVGCDGGGSIVRQHLGIGLSGQSRIMNRYMTHFRSDARELLQRWGVAWHYQSPLGTLIAQNDVDLWTLHSRLAAEDDEPDPSRLLQDFLGQQIAHQVLVSNRWSPHLLVADEYGRGRVLLAGDAVHQYIPTGGYGMNTGIGDAHDLGWKLAALLQGFAGPGLLRSYEAERRPVGLRNCKASGAHNAVRVEIARRYRAADLDKQGEAHAHRIAALGEEIAALGNAENESMGIELGYSYSGSPIISSDPDEQAPEDPGSYIPTTVPGVRLPSVMLADGIALQDRLGPWFTLLGFGVEPSETFAVAAARLGMPLAMSRFNQPELVEIYGRRQILVRPDQHVAWRGDVVTQDAADRICRLALGFIDF